MIDRELFDALIRSKVSDGPGNIAARPTEMSTETFQQLLELWTESVATDPDLHYHVWLLCASIFQVGFEVGVDYGKLKGEL